ncbi:MAG TPA: hypothetical protein VJ782_01540 [Aeromicrobium sp.]|nr:hypothetical protein [Aeromicrobium sp.]
MAGNPTNAAVWGGADVLIAPVGSPIPVGNAAFSAAWDYVGLLDGGQGFEESIETESTDHEAWGYGVIATTYKGTKVTKTFTSVEENSVVMGLVYDVDGMTFDDVLGTYVGDLAVRDNTERVMVAFVTTSGDNERRMITKNYATIAATSAGSESEEALAAKSFTVTIVPDSSRILYYTYKGASL